MIFNLNSENKDDINNILENHDNINILYYSPLCYHCNNLKPTWIKLCDSFKNSKNIIIINASNNNIKNFEEKYRKDITGYPTILKYSKGKKKKEYNGNRNLIDLKNFVKK
jgi:thiol-disulfide isomerase/thioredoxin